MSTDSEILQKLMLAAAGTESGRGDDPWLGFLNLLARATLAEIAQLQVLRLGRPVLEWRIGGEGAENPLLSPEVVARMRGERVYSQIDLPLAPATASPLRAMRWTLGRDDKAVLALMRSGEDFRAMDGVRLSGLTPYLAPAILSWQRLAAERAKARIDRQLCHDLGADWILFSATGQVTDMSAGLADRLIAEFGIRRRADGWLDFPRAVTAAAFRRAMDVTEAAGSAQPVLISRDPWLQMLLSAEDVAGEPCLIARLRRARRARDLPVSHIAASFGLSRSEARLAVLICDGCSLQDAARDLGWTIETARSYSKQIFARMGVSGQSGVVRRMLESAVWLA